MLVISSKEDILNPKEVRGFSVLTEKHQKVFEKFLLNFTMGYGIEARKTIRPISIKLKKDKANGWYLRFDYYIYGKKDWLHVKTPWQWY